MAGHRIPAPVVHTPALPPLPALAATVLGLACCAASIGAIAENNPDGRHILGGSGLLLALAGLHVRQWRQVLAGGQRRWEQAASLAGQLALTFLPFLVFSERWLAVPGFLAGTALLVLPALWRWIGFAAVAAVQCVLAATLLQGTGVTLLAAAGAVIVGLLLFMLLRTSVLIRDLHLAHAADLSHERRRFDRDLHDLLGNRLSIIGVKSELAQRLVDTDPGRARAQLGDVITIARDTQRDARAVAHGCPVVSLARELTSARSALDAAGARCEIAVSCAEPSREVTTVLAAVVREGVANVLRHSLARECRIELRDRDGSVRLSVRNDGVVDRDPDPGRGIADLRERAAAVGGRLMAGRVGADGFELVAELPGGDGAVRDRADHRIGGGRR